MLRRRGMSDAIRAYADASGLGEPERRIALKGQVELADGSRADAELWRTARGLVLIAAKSASEGRSIPLVEGDGLRYLPGRFSDGLELDGAALGVPTGKGGEVQKLIARQRLCRGDPAPEMDRAHHIQQPDEIERCFLHGFLSAEEILLAWLPGSSRLPVRSSIVPDGDGEVRFLLTDRRAALVALNTVGDVRVEALEHQPLRVEAGQARSGEHRWKAAKGAAKLLSGLARLPALEAPERLREAARVEWLARRDERSALPAARRLLDAASKRGDTLAAFAAFLVGEELEEARAARPELPGAVDGLEGQPSGVLAQLYESWAFSVRAGDALLGDLRELGEPAEPWALALHVAVHASAEERARDPIEGALADIALAEHLLARKERERARDLLEARLSALPSEALEDLLPPRDADLTAGAGGQALRIRVYELLAEARGPDRDTPDVRALAELARLQPLVVERVQALAQRADGELRDRARHVLSVLSPGGLAPGAVPAGDPAAPHALADEQLWGALRHPLVREGGALLGRLQTLLASVPLPDVTVIRDYCERLSTARHRETTDALEHAARALDNAARMLGVAEVLAYVSRGDKGVGMRGYEQTPPFVLIGGRHIEPDSEYRMQPRELAFAIGTEVAHLRYGHSRVTSSDVWAGALEKSKQGLDLALGVLPMLKSWRVANRVSRLASRVPQGALKRVVGGAAAVSDQVRRVVDPQRQSEDISALNEDLIAAHRVMQLTADRAGLLLAGEIGSALRAMLLVRRDYRRELPAVEQKGIEPILARRDAEGEIAYQDLAVRVAALLSFYLSDDYARLQSSLAEADSAQDTANL